MQFMAQLSQATPSRQVPFWTDAQDTEEWLSTLNKAVSSRQVVVSSRSWPLLQPWLAWQRAPLLLEGWFYPVDVDLTWTYLLQFLMEQSPHSVVIPCGSDAWVRWTADQVTIHAPLNSWVWEVVQAVWRPRSWESLADHSWQIAGRLQQAHRYAWGIGEFLRMGPQFEEWRITAQADRLVGWWRALVERFGPRAMRVIWSQEQYLGREQLLGLPVHVKRIELVTGQIEADQWRNLVKMPTRGIKVRARWDIPRWNGHWENQLELRKWQQSSRLHAHFRPISSDMMGALRTMRREIRRLPLLQVSPLELEMSPMTGWPRVTWISYQYQQREKVRQWMLSHPWLQASRWPVRIRLTHPRWFISPVESNWREWVCVRSDGTRILVAMPRYHYPGNVTLSIPGTVAMTLNELDPEQRLDRYKKEWRYWAAFVALHLIPQIENAWGK